MNSQQARYLRQQRRDGNFENNNNGQQQYFSSQIKNAEKKLTEPNIDNQLNYFGYMLEPFSMKEEREIGKITKEGFFAINKSKEKEASDRWLDSLLTTEQQLLLEQNNQLAEERLHYKVQPKRGQVDERDKEEGNPEEIKYKQIERMINLLEDKQQINQALNQLKSKIPAQNFQLKKNVRKKVKLNEEKKEESEQQKSENIQEAKDKLAQVVSLATYFVEKCGDLDKLDIYKKTKEQLQKELELQKPLVEEELKAQQLIQEQQDKEDQIFSDVEEEGKEIKPQNEDKEDSDSDDEEEKSQEEESSEEEESEDEMSDFSNNENKKKKIQKSKQQIEDQIEDESVD